MKKKIYLAGGCFWGLQAYLQNIQGIIDTKVAYANSNIDSPSYEDVCSGLSSASETVIVTYDNDKISLEQILESYYEVIDPTSKNKQGNDIGSQYRTGIYYENDEDLKKITASLIKLQSKLDNSIQIEVLPLHNIYLAEEYHQNYLQKNPNGYCHIPKTMIEEAKEKTF